MAINYWHQLVEGEIYHIYNRTVSDLKCFKDEIDYKRFLENWDKYFNQYLDLYAYCLVPNHFHFLVRVKSIGKEHQNMVRREHSKVASNFIIGKSSINELIVDQFRRFLSGYSLYHRKRYFRSGPLFLPKFKRVLVRSELKCQWILCYIHHNVIHHNLGKTYSDWSYTSYHHFKDRVNSELGFSLFENEDHFFQYHEEFRLQLNMENELLVDD